MSAMAVSVDIFPAREARLTAAQTGRLSRDALMFHAQLAWQGTSCCAVERRGQNFTLVTCITSFMCDTSTVPHKEEKIKQETDMENYMTMGVEEMELHEVSKAEYDIYILTCLLHYHERMTMPVGQGLCRELAEEACPRSLVQDQYAEALREAIRCIKEVRGL